MQSETDHKPFPQPVRAERENAYREIRYDETIPAPDTLLSLLKYEYLRQELWVPLEKREGRICVLIDDPNNILKRDAIESLLKTLTYREREIIRLRYGLGDGYTYTLEEVGRIFKVTRERVRQVEAKAIRKLQHPVRARKLEGFLDHKSA